jgi:hypothetical protein
MALQAKLTKVFTGFVPYDLKLTKEVRPKKAVRITSEQIPWARLNEQEFQSQWGTCLNALHYYETAGLIDREDFMPYFVAYLKIKKYTKEQIDKLLRASDKLVTFGLAGRAYLLMVGNVDHPGCNATDKFLTKQLRAVLERVETEEPVDKQDLGQTELLGELQGLEDELSDIDIVEFLRSRGTPKRYLPAATELLQRRLAELVELRDGKDEQLKEAYRHLSKKQVVTHIEWYETTIAAIEDYSTSRKRTVNPMRKARVPKAKPADKVVAKLKYKHSDAKLGIVSADPNKLVGSQQVWLYSVKYRKLAVYHPLPNKFMTVKGTSMADWDPETSVQKTLRWPEEQLKAFMDAGGKRDSKKYFDSIRSTEVTLRGRLDENWLILKVF